MFFSTGRGSAVADPVGGKAGDEVTKLAMRVLARIFEAGGGDLQSAIAATNRAVIEQVRGDARLRGAGCTIAAIRVDESVVSIAWVGDVRAYRLHGKQFTCLTEDHSLLNQSVRERRLHPEDIAKFPHKNVIVRALGMTNAQADVRSERCEAGDLVVLATSDVYLALGEELLATILRRHEADPDRCRRAILDDACVNGGGGTVLVVSIGGRPTKT